MTLSPNEPLLPNIVASVLPVNNSPPVDCLTLLKPECQVVDKMNETWVMPDMSITIICIVLFVEFTISTATNTLLMVTILFSPRLRTPPNTQLISVCANDLLISLTILMSMVSMLHISTNKIDPHDVAKNIFHNCLVFLKLLTFAQYFCSFTSIGYYRSKTLRHPTLSLSTRQKLISRWITGGWILSLGNS